MSSMKTSTHNASQPRGWSWAFWGATTGVFLAVLFGAPAQWIARALDQLSEGRLRLDNAKGTWWQGRARLTLTSGSQGRDAMRLPGWFRWRLGLGMKGPSIHMDFDCCTSSPLIWSTSAGLGGIRISLADQAAASQWPIELLTGLGAPWNTIQADGQMQLQTRAFSLLWAQGRVQWYGKATIQLNNISSRLSTLSPMGSYDLEISGPATGTATPEVNLTTTRGPLQLAGQGKWVGHQLRFSGQASADSGFEDVLNNLLNVIGRRNGNRSILSIG